MQLPTLFKISYQHREREQLGVQRLTPYQYYLMAKVMLSFCVIWYSNWVPLTWKSLLSWLSWNHLTTFLSTCRLQFLSLVSRHFFHMFLRHCFPQCISFYSLCYFCWYSVYTIARASVNTNLCLWSLYLNPRNSKYTYPTSYCTFPPASLIGTSLYSPFSLSHTSCIFWSIIYHNWPSVIGCTTIQDCRPH